MTRTGSMTMPQTSKGFKVGDGVQFIDTKSIRDCEKMFGFKLIGRTGKVVKIGKAGSGHYTYPYRVRIGNYSKWFGGDELSLVSKMPRSRLKKGDEVIIRMANKRSRYNNRLGRIVAITRNKGVWPYYVCLNDTHNTTVFGRDELELASGYQVTISAEKDRIKAIQLLKRFVEVVTKDPVDYRYCSCKNCGLHRKLIKKTEKFLKEQETEG